MRRALWTSLACCLGAAGAAWGQGLAPVGTGGVAALASALEQLGSDKRVLVIAAHPDDEDNPFLAWLGRGAGAHAAYLSLTRGEGGQNLIGPELGPELGVIRTEELLSARRIDGTGQFFARAYDFGFSKSADESFRFWPRDSLLRDVLDVMRRFRPQIVVAIFSGTPRDGHGQHQVSALVARQAFEILKDSSGGPVKLYRSTGFLDTAATTVRIPSGVLDPILGQSYLQIGAAARSRHRSQDQGQLQRVGPATIRLSFVEGRVPAGTSLFAGVDTVLHGRERYVALVDSARAALSPYRPGAIVPYLVRALDALGAAGDEEREALEETLARAAGVTFDGTADDGILTPGERVQVEATVWNASDASVRVDSITLAAPSGWAAQLLDAAGATVGPDSVATKRFVLTVAPNASRSQPYFLRRPLIGALYDWAGVSPDVRGTPFEPPPVSVRAWVRVGGRTLALTREVVYRYRDQGVGEVRRPLFVTQDFDVQVTPELVVWPVDAAASGPRRFTVTVTNRKRGASHVQVAVTVPRGWSGVPPETLAFDREDETKSVSFAVQPPPHAAAAVYGIAAAAAGPEGRESRGWLGIMDYPHIRPRPIAHPSTAEIRLARIALPPLTHVGYVRGAADRVPEALAGVGVPVEIIPADSLERGDLSRYNAIVIGSRAYEVDPALVKNNGRLLDYARSGGLVIVQYQQYPFVDGHFAPYPITIARPHDRVTDESAPVTLLDSTNAVFHHPNEIGREDWTGWIQDRGLYFARTWDSSYVSLLEMHDPGEPPLRGGLLVAHVGTGTYVYTGLAFFRQLPAGVPGAYRLFANLLALGKH